MTIRRPHLHGGVAALLAVALGLQSVPTAATAHQSDTQAITASTTSGTVTLQAAGTDATTQVGADAQAASWGDVLQVGDGEAALNAGSTLATRVFHHSQAHILGNSGPDATADPVSVLPAGGQMPAHELLYGTTYNTASADPTVARSASLRRPARRLHPWAAHSCCTTIPPY